MQKVSGQSDLKQEIDSAQSRKQFRTQVSWKKEDKLIEIERIDERPEENALQSNRVEKVEKNPHEGIGLSDEGEEEGDVRSPPDLRMSPIIVFQNRTN